MSEENEKLKNVTAEQLNAVESEIDRLFNHQFKAAQYRWHKRVFLENCNECGFFLVDRVLHDESRGSEYLETSNIGICRRNPPAWIPGDDTSNKSCSFPTVTVDGWCGHFKEFKVPFPDDDEAYTAAEKEVARRLEYLKKHGVSSGTSGVAGSSGREVNEAGDRDGDV